MKRKKSGLTQEAGRKTRRKPPDNLEMGNR